MTKARAEELRRLLSSRQPTFGASRTRVQNTLVAAGLATYVEVDGMSECEITLLGGNVLRHYCASKAPVAD
jgi:hypothetical protein